jgi:uncharacterized protein YndB with AHSA1/START domain
MKPEGAEQDRVQLIRLIEAPREEVFRAWTALNHSSLWSSASAEPKRSWS